MLHLVDFVVYRVTKRNVGPWGLSAVTERRPMYLSPQLMTTVPLPHGTTRRLTATLAQLDAEDQVVHNARHTHSDLVRRFLGPLREDPLVELAPGPGVGGVGACSAIPRYGSLSLQRPPPAELLSGAGRSDRWTLPVAVAARPIEIRVGDRRLRLAARVPAKAQKGS